MGASDMLALVFIFGSCLLLITSYWTKRTSGLSWVHLLLHNSIPSLSKRHQSYSYRAGLHSSPSANTVTCCLLLEEADKRDLWALPLVKILMESSLWLEHYDLQSPFSFLASSVFVLSWRSTLLLRSCGRSISSGSGEHCLTSGCSLLSPAEFSTYLNFCRSLRFDDKPDYSYLRQLFRNLFHRQGFSYDYVFDWNMLKFVSVCVCRESAGWDVDGFYGMEIWEENKKLPVICTSPQWSTWEREPGRGRVVPQC